MWETLLFRAEKMVSKASLWTPKARAPGPAIFVLKFMYFVGHQLWICSLLFNIPYWCHVITHFKKKLSPKLLKLKCDLSVCKAWPPLEFHWGEISALTSTFPPFLPFTPFSHCLVHPFIHISYLSDGNKLPTHPGTGYRVIFYAPPPYSFVET